MSIIQYQSCGCCRYSLPPQFFHPFAGFSGRAFPTPNSTARAVLENSTPDSVVDKVVEADPFSAIKKRASEISSDLKGTSIFLVGMNNSYKSSLGVILADALRYYFFDSDSLVEEAVGGKGAAVSLVESEEEGYLASETEVLKQLSSMGRLIVCAGNGAVKSSSNLALLRHGISIWIDVPLDLVAREIMEDRIQLSASDTTICKSSDEILDQLTTLYDSGQSGYSTADATISLQSSEGDRKTSESEEDDGRGCETILVTRSSRTSRLRFSFLEKLMKLYYSPKPTTSI
ncbi:probable inactive shikimate kinase like 1, chloroplastic isoform X1 [Primulina huaijiensis]|uniref:probable inactive shikimate kinase like 1, chloroplastic isoform X1 n=1 Tax=Primulina huaijiensis TaxID=1492673 RepID=UPI003CC70DAB